MLQSGNDETRTLVLSKLDGTAGPATSTRGVTVGELVHRAEVVQTTAGHEGRALLGEGTGHHPRRLERHCVHFVGCESVPNLTTNKLMRQAKGAGTTSDEATRANKNTRKSPTHDQLSVLRCGNQFQRVLCPMHGVNLAEVTLQYTTWKKSDVLGGVVSPSSDDCRPRLVRTSRHDARFGHTGLILCIRIATKIHNPVLEFVHCDTQPFHAVLHQGSLLLRIHLCLASGSRLRRLAL